MRLRLHGELVTPTGNVMSVGILNQLGRPNLESLAVLAREAIQNSWDARAVSDKPVFFGINGWTMGEDQRAYLTTEIFGDLPPSSSLPLINILENEQPLDVLVLYDRRTMGLGGSTRADEVTDEGVSNFVNFLRNVGQPSGKSYSGGTYGYGKAAFYRASQAKTICVYTRTCNNGQLESRFMAAALGEPYTENKRRYTGRFWWGVPAEDNEQILDPIINEQADELAAHIGMPLFKGDECGTNIMVLQPHFGERTPLQAVNMMAETIIWYSWPKLMIQNSGYPAVEVSVFWQGQKIEVPLPEAYPPLQGFVEAIYRLKGGEPVKHDNMRHEVRTLGTARPKQDLGNLVLQEFALSGKSLFDTGANTNNKYFASLNHHTAVMRQPELVVKYLPGTPLTDTTKGYAGVFITAEAVDSIFAFAETPTHDDWIASSLTERHHRTFVNQAIRQIEHLMNSFSSEGSGSSVVSLSGHSSGTFARRLGSLLLRKEEDVSVQAVHRNVTISQLPELSDSIDIVNLPELVPIPSNSRIPTVIPREEIQLLDEEFQPILNVPMVEEYSGRDYKKSYGRAVIYCSLQQLVVTEDGTTAVKVDFNVEHSPNSIGTRIRITTHILLDGNTRESAPPVGQDKPKIIYWIDMLQRRYEGTEELFVPASVKETCSVLVSIPSNVMLRIELNGLPWIEDDRNKIVSVSNTKS